MPSQTEYQYCKRLDANFLVGVSAFGQMICVVQHDDTGGMTMTSSPSVTAAGAGLAKATCWCLMTSCGWSGIL